MSTEPRMPELEFLPPNCPFCDMQTDSDADGLVCLPCNIWWDTHGRHGERMNAGEVPICGEEDQPYLAYPEKWMQVLRYRCVLDEGHELPHHGVRTDDGNPDDTHSWREAKTAAHA